MRRTAWSIAVLLGLATLTAQAHATPTVAATVTLENDTIEIGSKHGWSDRHWGSKRDWSDRDWSGKRGWSNRHWSSKPGWSNRHLSSKRGWSNRHWSGKRGFHHRGKHKGRVRHDEWHDHVGRDHRPDRHHHPAFVVKRIYKAPVVIVRPGWGRSFRHLRGGR